MNPTRVEKLNEESDMALVYETGGVWEEREWKILINYKASKLHDKGPCSHCKHIIRGVGDEPEKWIIPRVVTAQNQSQFDSTGVCLDCILEAAACI